MRGWYAKYRVTKIGDITGRHRRCVFFVLDLTHDPAARRAALEYATAKNDPDLIRDLAEECSRLEAS